MMKLFDQSLTGDMVCFHEVLTRRFFKALDTDSNLHQLFYNGSIDVLLITLEI